MPDAWSAAFQAIKNDRPPKQIVRNIHYVISNENRHFLFRDAVQTGAGGVYIGVGSDQNYLLSGWSRPDVLVLMDFDQVVVDLHRVYRLLFLNADNPETFMSMWGLGQEKQVRALIDAAYPDAAQRRQVRDAYHIGRLAVHNRLRRVKALYRKLNVPCFLNDAEQYRFIVSMFRANRVFMVRGDLTADVSVRDIAAAARAANMPVRTIYLSNAEKYFPYTPGFKNSMLLLPTDEQSVVIRTWGFHNGRYNYTVQKGNNFQAWLRDGKTTSVASILRFAEASTRRGDVSTIRATPDLTPPANLEQRPAPVGKQAQRTRLGLTLPATRSRLVVAPVGRDSRSVAFLHLAP